METLSDYLEATPATRHAARVALGWRTHRADQPATYRAAPKHPTHRGTPLGIHEDMARSNTEALARLSATRKAS